MIIVAHLSDTHLNGTERNLSRARRAMDYLNSLPGHIDAIVVTGDLTDNSLPAEFDEAASVLRSPVPLFTCLGNHDARLRTDAALNSVHHIDGATFVMCDSTIPGEDGGHLDEPTLVWLAATLHAADPRVPVFVCLHHPPATLHNAMIDSIRLDNPDPFEALLRSHPQVKAVLAGHAHTAATTVFAGLPLLVAPGIVSTLRLPWEVPDSLTWGNTIDFGREPAVAFHVLDDSGRVTTHFRVVD